MQQLRFEGLELAQQLSDLTGTGDEIADETLQVIDEPRLEGHHRAGVRALQFESACQAGHECLGIVRQTFEYVHEVAQRFVHLGRVYGGRSCELPE